MITRAKLLRSVQTGTDEVTLDRDIADAARRSLERMNSIGSTAPTAS